MTALAWADVLAWADDGGGPDPAIPLMPDEQHFADEDEEPAARFFAALYAGQTGVLEVRTFGPEDSDQSDKAKQQRATAARLRDFVPVENGALDVARVARFLNGCAKAELGAFFGVALRTPSAARDRKGDAAHCQTLTALYVDADFKKIGEAETRKRLAAFSTAPSILVNSGGGLHPYLLLHTPIDLQTGYDDARGLLRRLAYSVAAIVDTSVSEPARVLRIPGSLNFKYTPPRPVTIEQFTDARVDPADLPLIELAPQSGNGTSSDAPFRMPEAIIKNDRHETLRLLMRSLQAHGVGLEGALAACHIENNAKGQPPLDRKELDSYLRRASQYADAPGFVRTPKAGWELAASLNDIGLSREAVLAAVCSVTPDFDPEAVDETPPLVHVAPSYAFEPAFPPGHFVTQWIGHFKTQCDAALEFHEAAALVALAAATPSLIARISGSADGLRTNLNILLIGDAGRTRKSTAKDYAVETLRRALPHVLLPEQMTQESFVESLTLCNGGAALWAIDEFTDTLSKIVNATYLAGMRGLLLELYARTDYTYRRVSKGAKKHEDNFTIRNVTLSVIGCATPTLFQQLDSTAVGSGLLTRFAIVMPESKPPRLPQFALQEETVPNALVQWLHDISKRRQDVVFEPGVLERLDEDIDKPLDESADRCSMTVRAGVMARKVAMLSAAGQKATFALENTPLTVTLGDAEAAIRVVTRWIGYAQKFEARTEESSFEVKVQKCLAIVKGRTINRREVTQRVHVPAKELLEIEKTLEQRELIEVIQRKPPTGRPSTTWRWVG
jgi:hypothetical protein